MKINNNIEFKDYYEFNIKLFFFNLIPMIAFITLCDEWKEFYGINQENLDKDFKKAYKELFKSMLTNSSVITLPH